VRHDDTGRLYLPLQGTGIDRVKANAVFGEMPTQQLPLFLAKRSDERIWRTIRCAVIYAMPGV
jgi:hypothetical protein